MSATSDLDLGVIGITPGNGHPYSFAAIANGYSDEGFAESDWGVIHDYLAEKDDSEFGFDGVRVTHAWTQDPAETRRLCDAARIDEAVDDLEDLRSEVDAVLLLRGDYENHAEMARPFLADGTPVFVDKPLAMDVADVRALAPSLRGGTLMSCSGMRYASALDGPRAHLASYGDVRLVRGTVINDWAKYGVHMLDAVFGVLDQRPASVRATPAEHDSVTIEMDGGTQVQVDALGDGPFTFSVDVYGSERTSRHDLVDNFTAFRRTLWRFVEMVRSGEPVLDPERTLDVVRTLVAGRRSREEDRPVPVSEVDV